MRVARRRNHVESNWSRNEKGPGPALRCRTRAYERGTGQRTLESSSPRTRTYRGSCIGRRGWRLSPLFEKTPNFDRIGTSSSGPAPAHRVKRFDCSREGRHVGSEHRETRLCSGEHCARCEERNWKTDVSQEHRGEACERKRGVQRQRRSGVGLRTHRSGLSSTGYTKRQAVAVRVQHCRTSRSARSSDLQFSTST